MRILAIETSCDETAAAVVTDGRTVESNVVSSQIDVHRATGGVVPEVAARLQLEMIRPVIEQALREATTTWRGVDALAVTVGPGLIGPLTVGIETAKAIAAARQKPLIAVNHLAGHLYAGLIEVKRFRFPYLGLVVSGGHTELVWMNGHHRFRLLGSTRDDAAGEALDKVGKLLGLPYPGGPEIARLASAGDPAAIPFSRPLPNSLDFSFSGLKTEAARTISRLRPLTRKRKADLAAGFQRAVVESLVEKTTRAALRRGPQAVILGGGVAANQSLRQRLAARLAEADIPLVVTPRNLATDNAAMIGLAAYWQRDAMLTGPRRFAATADPGLVLGGRAAAAPA